MRQKIFRLLLAVMTMLTIGNIQAAKKVHMLGDSTMQPYDENTTGTRGWGMYFGNFLTGGWTATNYAVGGRDSRGGYNELWQKAKNSVEAGDYVIIQFAHNDTKYDGMDNLELQEYYTSIGDATNAAAVKKDGRGTTPSTTYKACLKQIVDAVKEKNAIPILMSAVCRCNLSNGVVGRNARHDLGGKYSKITESGILTNQSLPESDHTMDYTYHMKQLASELGVQFIDMTAATKSLYESYGTQEKLHAAFFDKGPNTPNDNTHFNLTGALTAAKLAAQLLKDAGILADNIEIPTDLAITPSEADMGEVYVGQSATKELTLNGLGMEPSSGTITITADNGVLLSTDKQNWQNTLEVSYENGTVIKTFYAKMNVTATGIMSGTVTATIGDKTAKTTISVTGIELGGGESFTATWALTSNDNAVVDGNATAADAKVNGMAKYGNNGQNGLMVSTSDGGAWVKAEDDSPNQYVQFTVTAPDGKKLDINHITMKIGGRGGSGMRCHAYYSTDGFATRTTIYAPASMASGVLNEVDVTPVIKLEEGDQLQIRIYPWYTSDATGKWLCVKDVIVGGQAKDAAGVNIPGTITYKLDKGGLNENNDQEIITPNELSAGFAGKKWDYEGTNEKVVIEGTTFQGASGNTPMMQLKFTGKTDETLSTVADDDCTISLTLTPEDGFSFIPSKVSFLAGKFNSGNPHLTFAVEAGDTKKTLKDNVELNRSKTTPLVDPSSFSEELSGFTATADAPLKLKFSFLNVQGTRSAGIGNLVIEGTLVGAATQVTKYALNTQVVPSEAGAIDRDPDMETYKEGTKVTLKATKNFGYKFKEWQDAAGAVVSTDAETTITMDGEKTVKAVFETVPIYTVTTDVKNDADRDLGSITLSPNDHDGKYEAGTKITATANTSKILKFTNWEDNSTSAEREITVDKDMTIIANYEVQDFIAVFDASKTAAYATQGTYPFSADVTWDADRNAKVSIVKQNDGSLVTGTNATPVVRNRANSGVLNTLSGVFQNGYNAAEIAWQYQFSTVGFTKATFEADMAAKNAATKNWKAQVSTDGTTFEDLGEAWTVASNTLTPLSFTLPATAIGKETVYVRIMGTGTELLSDKYTFNAGTSAEGLVYATNSESQVGNVYVLGEAIVVADETAPVIIATIPADGATNVSATGKITITFDEKIEAGTANGVATLNNQPINANWSSKSVSFSYSNLDYNTEYTFQMPAGFVQDKSGNVYNKAVNIVFTTMNRPTVEKGLFDVVVSTTEELSAAINTANTRADKNTRFRIFIKKGVYKLPTGATKHYVHQNGDKTITYWEGDLPDPITYVKAANISFIGEDRETTIITQDITNDADMLFDGQFGKAHKYEEINNSAVLQLESSATGTYFQDITIKSGINDALGRNLAIHDKSSKTIYKNTLLYGYQDTWTSNNEQGLFYFEDGQVRGRTDYLCGKGDAYFNGVELLQIASGYAAVPSTPRSIGWVFNGCQISADGSGVDGTYTLGRPWGKGTPVAVFIDTKMNVAPKAEGWSEMSNGWPKRFAEYNSFNAKGNAIDLGGRKTTFAESHTNNPVLSEEEATNYSDMSKMFGDWQPTLLTEQAPVPTDVKLDGEVLSWTGSNYALLYAVCEDGDIIGFTTETQFDLSSIAALSRRALSADRYTVRAANEMGGMSSASVPAVATGINMISQHDIINSQDIYTIDGRRVNNLQKGVNIVRLQKADGSVKTVKVIQ